MDTIYGYGDKKSKKRGGNANSPGPGYNMMPAGSSNYYGYNTPTGGTGSNYYGYGYGSPYTPDLTPISGINFTPTPIDTAGEESSALQNLLGHYGGADAIAQAGSSSGAFKQRMQRYYEQLASERARTSIAEKERQDQIKLQVEMQRKQQEMQQKQWAEALRLQAAQYQQQMNNYNNQYAFWREQQAQAQAQAWQQYSSSFYHPAGSTGTSQMFGSVPGGGGGGGVSGFSNNNSTGGYGQQPNTTNPDAPFYTGQPYNYMAGQYYPTNQVVQSTPSIGAINPNVTRTQNTTQNKNLPMQYSNYMQNIKKKLYQV